MQVQGKYVGCFLTILIILVPWVIVIKLLYDEDIETIVDITIGAIFYSGLETLLRKLFPEKKEIPEQPKREILEYSVEVWELNKRIGLKFRCQTCGKDIIVRFLKIGETAKCKACGSENVVPKLAIEIQKES
jgi:predicted RNA-binding Zn-ribbon protein involved in translation (DUF1610 family)